MRVQRGWETSSAATTKIRWSSMWPGSMAKRGSIRPGHPQTPQAHLTERYTRTDSLTLKYEVTIDDPGAYSKPWTTSNTVSWRPGFQLMEFICNENEKDSVHMTKERL